MKEITPITIAYGDGIGPEIMHSVLRILQKSSAPLQIEVIEIGEKLYRKEYQFGISETSWKSINNTKILLKAPTTTPQGKGHKSINVALRKALGLFANIRPVKCYHPFIKTQHPNIDIVVIRENEEDLYCGIEYRHTQNVRESVKLISHIGSERIIRYAFEYAMANNRKKVTCFTKDNIMKLSDGLFHKIFDQISQEYKGIIAEHYIVDIGMAKLARCPEVFDVIVAPNLFGDIASDITSELSGSVALGGSANIGTDFAVFEAVHGSAPDIAEHNIANPSGLINAAVMMLSYLGHLRAAHNISNALKKTIEDGIHTADIFNDHSTRKVGTTEFTDEIIKRLVIESSELDVLPEINFVNTKQIVGNIKDLSIEIRKHVGVDIYLNLNAYSAHDIADKIKKIDLGNFTLRSISSMGLNLWPHEAYFMLNSDHWCCRFIKKDIDHSSVIGLLEALVKSGFDFIKIENLYEYNDLPGYSD